MKERRSPSSFALPTSWLPRLALFLLPAAALFAPSPLPAQSFYSMRGFGEEVLASDGVSSGLGGLFTFSPRNPAYPLSASKTNFTVGMTGVLDYASDGKNQRLIGDGRPDFFRARVPLPLRLRLGLGFSEWYNQDFSVYSESLSDYRRHVAGKGGIYDLCASLSRSFGDFANLGLEYGHLLGSSTEFWEMDVYNGNYVTLDSVAYTYQGNALRLGGTVRPPPFHIFRGGESWISLGGFFEQVLDFHIDSRTHTHGTTSESLGLEASFPARYGVGLTLSPVPELKLGAEAVLQPASQIKIGGADPVYVRDASRIAVGGEYMLDERHPLRLGLHIQDWYLLAAGGQPIKEIGVSAGSSLPITGFGAFDFSLEYANRTSQALAENVLRAQVSFYFEESWKKRTRNWGY